MIDPTDPLRPVVPPATRPAGPEPTPLSTAQARFFACRWHKLQDEEGPAHCTQPDVRSMAGVAGFSAESWCADCDHFKVRRGSRRPQPFS